MRIYRVDMLVKWNECHIISSSELKITRTTEKKIFIDVGGFEKEIKKEFLNRLKNNEQTKNRNVEYYENYIYCEDIQIGKEKLIESYKSHKKKALEQFNIYLTEQ
ncbi:MAG: hypothetical protein ACTSQG_00050 [Promethearchaeota archaeon]